MDEKRFEEILERNNEKIINSLKKDTEEKLSGLEKRTEEKLSGLEKRTEKKLNGLEKRTEEKLSGLEKRTEEKLSGLEKRTEEKLNVLEKRMEKRFDEIEQKRIDDNFYFEHKYWDKISIIFDKLQLNDDIKKTEDERNLKLEQKVENNSSKLMSLDFRVSKLENKH